MTRYGTLLYVRKGIEPQPFPLRGGSTVIGRDPESDLLLDAEGVSGAHVRITATPGSCTVTDLDSAAGTFLNQVRLRPHTPQALHDGDTLRIGPFAVRYMRPEPAPTGPPVAGGGGDGRSLAERTRSTAAGVLPPEIARRIRPGEPPVGPPGPPARRLRGNADASGNGAHRGGQASSYLQYLPPLYQESEFLGRFLLIFESILDPIDRTLGQIDLMFNPQVAPEALLPWLATWVDLVLNEKWPLERRRALISAAAELYRWRGTRRGLSEYIRIYTGVTPLIVEPRQQEPSLPAHVFRVVLDVPDPAEIDRTLVEAIIEAEKPAHTAYLLEIRQA